MAKKSKIEWTEETWNPVTGCSKVSAGCKNCYAEVMAVRLKAMGVKGYENGFGLTLHHERLLQPMKNKRPTTYFVNSMSDLFHQDIPDIFIDEVFDTISLSTQHTFQVLTKRPERMNDYFAGRGVPPNAWLGVSVENIAQGVPRISVLRKIAAEIRFLSVEPLLEDLRELDLENIAWVIVGGESGARARPMKSEWVENIRLQCEAQKVAFFFKQWGSWGADGRRRSKGENGRLLAGKLHDGMPVAQRDETMMLFSL